MPQFDFSTYSSQIFWFLVCFSIFYYFVSKAILPRIGNILQERQENISANLVKASSLSSETKKIKEESELLKQEAANSYKLEIEKVKQEITLVKDREIRALKASISVVNKESKERISAALDSSTDAFNKAVFDTATIIENKLFNKN